jgi:hypothetical protein
MPASISLPDAAKKKSMPKAHTSWKARRRSRH